ncbi:hypothetical protein FNV43_RR12219 [Rhamnella rubrinervis]|uniref:BRCT domain-containing protein n=1 Tax=Rhamnella rubrinervis TaxID=2594499 RepID=A0A8K0H7G7_9ROSA|nr:hypothetical protein FNV43_RR12219 [Rhamnella rubrinervis]
MLNAKAFKGANVFMSRNLVPPEIFDALHDALKQNGAEVFLCCDPSRSGPDDFHIISSPDHVKFEDLRAKGCNLLGPQCVLSCAREHRALPKQGFTCCLAMDGVNVLASGFDEDEKGKIEKLVTAMGGVSHTKASSDVSFVIVKNVLATKYKWALQKKPIVTVNWLYQCWIEHRIVPQESFRVLPFSGLTICVTRIPAAPEGDKYKVARRWGHICIVTRKWFDQSIARRACLNEESYPVQGGAVSSNKSIRGSVKKQLSQGKDIGSLQSASSFLTADTHLPAVSCGGFVDPDTEATLSQNTSSTFSAVPVTEKEGDSEVPIVQSKSEMNPINVDDCVANDSESEDSDLYLSECRILLVGFETSEMRRLVSIIRRGGGSRYMLSNDKLTHIVVGAPLENEKKELRSLAASGMIRVVRTSWLDDCNREKKEIPVLQKHIASDLLLPKGVLAGMSSINQGRISTAHLSMPSYQLPESKSSGTGMPSSLEKSREEKPKTNMKGDSSAEKGARSSQRSQLPVVNVRSKGQMDDKNKAQRNSQHDSVQNGKLSSVFKGKVFCFSNSFPEDRKTEILQWVNQGGGQVVDEHLGQSVHFTVECHGMVPKSMGSQKITYVSSHWIRSCLEDGCLVDVSSHILYSPLPCQIPLPGFESFRFCVSQYEEKDRLLLRNLCFVLGSKLVEKLTRKVTHLLCKFAYGPKYEAACKWRIHSVTSEWIFECVNQNRVVPLDLFSPREVSAQDQEAGLCTTSQFPTQAVRMISRDNSSQFPSLLEEMRNTQTEIFGSRNDSLGEEAKQLSFFNKRARTLENVGEKVLLSSEINLSIPILNKNSTEDNMVKDTADVSHVVPDVAAAIEDLLEQTSKIQDQNSPARIGCDKSLFSSSCLTLGQDHSDTHTVIGLSKHWSNRTGRKDEVYNSSGDGKVGMYDGFSETQTESQVVGYEEDLTGRQMLIDRVRTLSSSSMT